MQIELNRATFRCLVQLDLVTLLLWVPIIWFDLTSPEWAEFSIRFDDLVRQQFGQAAFDYGTVTLATAALIGLIMWAIASAIGLLWFLRWARFGFACSLVIVLVAMVAILGNTPSFSTPVQDVVGAIGGMLSGAILLLSYAKGLGADWFAPGAD